ncbi:MAG TPA: hypothetical protein VKZ53_18420 [Candidatus Angelobacter sp.]|nr:hypothetical protein [Candidatus Angelobacter sp.]
MKYVNTCLFVILLGMIAQSQELSNIKRIKIISSGYDPQSHIAKIIFRNDSTKDITAFGISVTMSIDTKDGAFAEQHGDWIRDFIRTPAFDAGISEADVRARKKDGIPPHPELPNRPIHPGETVEDSQDFSYIQQYLTGVVIRVGTVLYSDGTAEADNAGSYERLLLGREIDTKAARRSVEIVQKALARKHDPHPMSFTIEELERAKAEVPAAARPEDAGEGFTIAWTGILNETIRELRSREIKRPGGKTDTGDKQPFKNLKEERNFLADFASTEKEYIDRYAKQGGLWKIDK